MRRLLRLSKAWWPRSCQILMIMLVFVGPVQAQDGTILPLFIPAIIGKPSPWPAWPVAGNPDGNCPVPAEAQAEDTSNPDVVIGHGTPQSCTSEAVVNAVAQGGIITFDCGPHPITITMTEPAKIFNNTGPKIVIDGGGKVALNGNNTTRILYMNTCDPNQIWTTPHCQDQDHPQLTVQNLAFVAGNSSNEEEYDGGGAIWARGGRLKIVNCRFFNNVCASTGPDVGGAVFFVSNNRTGHLIIKDSTLRNNPSDNFENYPGIFYLGNGDPAFINSIIE